MKKKILLIRPNASREALGNISKDMNSTSLPMGILYLSSFLKKHGHEAKILDDDLLRFSDEKMVESIKSFEPDFIGITMVSVAFKAGLQLARLIKKCSNATILAGGTHISSCYEEIINEYPEFDILVRGEGEYSLLKIVENIPLEKIDGISYRKGKKGINNPNLERITDLDSLPYPDFDQVDFSKYFNPIYRLFGYPMAPITTSRGCPFSCHYCASRGVFGSRVVYRSIDNVIKEVLWIKERYGIKIFQFWDDTLTLNHKRAIELSDRLKALKIRWTCNSRPSITNHVVYKHMKDSGCCLIFFGIESGNESILSSIGRGDISKEATIQLFDYLNEIRLDTMTSFILGLPKDTRKTILETIEFSKRLNPTFSLFFPLVPYPSTPIYEYAKKNNLLLFDKWEDFFVPKYKKLAIKHPTLKEAEIFSLVKKAYFEFYLRKNFFKKQLRSDFLRLEKIKNTLYLSKLFIKHFI